MKVGNRFIGSALTMDISIRPMPISVQPWSINSAIGGMEQNNAERSIMPEAGEPSVQEHGGAEKADNRR